MSMDASLFKKALKLLTRGSAVPMVEWLETVVLAALSAIVWMSSYEISLNAHSAGALLEVKHTSEFFWPLIFVVIIALRYGFSMGLISAIISILLTLSYFKYHGIQSYFSYYQAVGMLLVNMVAGEFRDAWEERFHRNDLDFEFMSRKLTLFTQNYFMLRSSHDQLEQRMAGQTVSLRSSISELEKLNDKYPILGVPQEKRVKNMAPYVLRVLSSVVGIEEAGMYYVDGSKVVEEPVATIGSMAPLDLNDPMLKDMLQSRELLSPVDLYNTENPLKYQLCIPLVDSEDKMHAFVVASVVKFFTLTSQNIAILNLVADYAADMLSSGIIAPVIKSSEKDLFLGFLKKCLDNHTVHGQHSSLVICRGYADATMALFDKSISLRRGADIYWTRTTPDGHKVLAVLLPLTSLIQAQLFSDRIKRLMHEESDGAIEIEIVGPLDVTCDNEKLIAEMQNLGIKDDDISYCFKSNQ